MNDAIDIAIYFALGLGGIAASLLVYFFARRAIVRYFVGRLEDRIARADRLLSEARQEGFGAMDRLLFQLGEVQDSEAVEVAVTKLLGEEDPELKTSVVQLFRTLGLVDRYLKQVRQASAWSDRANAARALGQLQVVEAIPVLVEAMRDPNEDTRSVKQAAARALGEIKAVDAVPLLMSALETVDEWASPRLAEVLLAYGEEALPHLLAALDDESNNNMRIWAAQILGKIGDSAATGPLLARLHDRSEQVRMSVAESLGNVGDRRAINDLVQVALRDPVAPVRAEAARSLGLLGDESVVQTLVNLLGDPDYWTRLRVIEAIEMIRPEDPSALDSALRDSSPEVRSRAAVALQRIGVLDQRIEDLAGNDRGVTERAHHTLVEMGRAGLMESILAFLEHSNLRVRSRIAAVVGEVGDLHALPALEPLLKDEQWPVRLRAVEAVARLRPKEGMAMVLGALSDEEETVRAAGVQAVRALGVGDGPEGIHAVLALFDTDNAEVRQSVIDAVGFVDQAEVDGVLERALLDPNEEVRLRAVHAVDERASADWVEALIGQLGDPSIRVRSVAVSALGRIGTPPALEGVVRSLTTPDREFREVLTDTLATHGAEKVLELAGHPRTTEEFLSLAWALGKTEENAALPRLRALSEHPLAPVRAAVGGALRNIEDRESETILLGLIGDRNERVRAAAGNALGLVGSERAIPRLIDALNDPDGFVRNRVALALGRLGGAEAFDALHARLTPNTEPRFRAHLVVGCGLAGGEEGFRLTLEELGVGETEEEVERVLAGEPPDVRQALQTKLHLEEKRKGLSAKDLAAQYAETLQTSQQAEQRAAAVKGLSALGVARYRDRLVDAVRTDPAADVRCLALRALATQIDDDQIARTFTLAFKDPSVDVQVEAATGLGQRADPQFNGVMLRSFHACEAEAGQPSESESAGKEELEQALVDALSRANAGRVSSFVDELMGYEGEVVLQGGAAVLGRLADPGAIGILRAWRDVKSAPLRSAAISALGHIGTVEARRSVLECVQDPSAEVRVAAAEALACIPGTESMEALFTLCRDPSIQVRMALAGQVGRRQHLSLISIAELLANDPVDEVRAHALRGLLILGDGGAVERFVELVGEQPEPVKMILYDTDEKDPAVSAAEELFRTDRRPAARIAAFRALSSLGSTTKERVLTACADPIADVRIAAIEAAAYLEDPEIEEALEKMLRDPDQDVRDAVRRGRLKLIDGA